MIHSERNWFRPGRKTLALISSLAALALAQCGGDSSPPATPATPTPPINTGPSPTPTPAALACSPTPPPIYGIRIQILDASGYRKLLQATPIVINEDEYCGKVGFDPRQWYCETRPADDPLRAACDAAAVGRASDNNRWGPTWFYEGEPCGPIQPGCENHETDQFKVYANGHGAFEACASLSISVAPDGARCGRVEL